MQAMGRMRRDSSVTQLCHTALSHSSVVHFSPTGLLLQCQQASTAPNIQSPLECHQRTPKESITTGSVTLGEVWTHLTLSWLFLNSVLSRVIKATARGQSNLVGQKRNMCASGWAVREAEAENNHLTILSIYQTTRGQEECNYHVSRARSSYSCYY
jgi:hypothetical protein